MCCVPSQVSVKAPPGKGGAKEDADPVAARLMQTNPVMEAIGNAKTVRNNNSSRFGKHFDIQFDEKGGILGAFTSIYLLEKPRITEHMKGERNYHVFYMLCKSDATIRDPVQCKNWELYKICSQAGTVAEVTSWNDNAEMKDMHAAYLKLGFSEQQRTELYMMLSFCLHLGNVDFEVCVGPCCVRVFLYSDIPDLIVDSCTNCFVLRCARCSALARCCAHSAYFDFAASVRAGQRFGRGVHDHNPRDPRARC